MVRQNFLRWAALSRNCRIGPSKLGFDTGKSLVTPLVVRARSMKGLRRGADAMHLVDMEELPSDELAGLASSAHLVGP